MDKQLKSMDRVLKALADPTRLRILGLLQQDAVCVCHIHDSLKISQPKASRHLAYLRRAGVVSSEKRGLWVYYRLASQPTPAVQAVLDAAIESTAAMTVTAQDAKRLEREMACAPEAVRLFRSRASLVAGDKV